ARFPAGLQPSSVAVGDFNGDGLPDFVVANLGSSDLSVWLDDPDNVGANFLPLTDKDGIPIPLLTRGLNPRKVVVGDFNGDKRLDIAVANFGDYGIQKGSVTAFLNTGDAAHPFSNDQVTQLVPNGIVYLLDMATGHFGGDPNRDDVAVLFFDAIRNEYGLA